MTFKLALCGIIIEIHHTYPYIAALCRDYLADGTRPADFCVSVTADDIRAERDMCPEALSDGIFEATAVHRRVVQGMVRYGVILIHSVAVAVDGEAYVFLAPSGVGKSTHAAQWKRHFGDKAVIVNGDKPMFSFAETDGRLTVHGSPWRGKEGWGDNISAPVKAFCFVGRGQVNRISAVDTRDIVRKLLPQVLLPAETADLARFMGLLDKLVRTVPFYSLTCTVSEEAAVVAYTVMSGTAT